MQQTKYTCEHKVDTRPTLISCSSQAHAHFMIVSCQSHSCLKLVPWLSHICQIYSFASLDFKKKMSSWCFGDAFWCLETSLTLFWLASEIYKAYSSYRWFKTVSFLKYNVNLDEFKVSWELWNRHMNLGWNWVWTWTMTQLGYSDN